MDGKETAYKRKIRLKKRGSYRRDKKGKIVRILKKIYL